MPYGVCKICGCTDNNPCYNPEYGTCWWVDDTHELCSHCADSEIANHPATEHCINSQERDLFPGIKNKNLAALGSPFPDDTSDMCPDCSHYSSSSIFTGRCDLGIYINE